MDRVEEGVTAPVLLFDLGGVVVDFRGGEGMRALTGHDLDYCRDQWWRLPELDLLERGALSPEEFAGAFMEKWRLDLDRAAFVDAFKHWVVGVYDGASDLLARLRANHRLACLSNVNPAHWERCVELGVPAMFDAHFLSHEMGFRKPQPEIYAAAADGLGVRPAEICFFDDVAANVDAARAFGMRATHVAAPSGLAYALRSAGIL